MPCQFCSSAGCDFIDVYVHAKSLRSCLSVTPWTAASKALLSMGFTRQESWSGSHTVQGIVPVQGSAWVCLGSCPGRYALHHCATGDALHRWASGGLTGCQSFQFAFLHYE